MLSLRSHKTSTMRVLFLLALLPALVSSQCLTGLYAPPLCAEQCDVVPCAVSERCDTNIGCHAYIAGPVVNTTLVSAYNRTDAPLSFGDLPGAYAQTELRFTTAGTVTSLWHPVETSAQASYDSFELLEARTGLSLATGVAVPDTVGDLWYRFNLGVGILVNTETVYAVRATTGLLRAPDHKYCAEGEKQPRQDSFLYGFQTNFAGALSGINLWFDVDFTPSALSAPTNNYNTLQCPVVVLSSSSTGVDVSSSTGGHHESSSTGADTFVMPDLNATVDIRLNEGAVLVAAITSGGLVVSCCLCLIARYLRPSYQKLPG